MKALILVDLQNDFMPGGNLAVQEGNLVVPIANDWMQQFEAIYATMDYHPQEHSSFASNHPNKKIGDFIEINGKPQILWPDHCVQGSFGAELHSDLHQQKITKKIFKGTNIHVDSYSGFFDNDQKSQTELDQTLKQAGIQELFILGLATDYCVQFTVLDALNLGYSVNLIANGCRAVNLNPDDGKKAIEEMKNAGAQIISID